MVFDSTIFLPSPKGSGAKRQPAAHLYSDVRWLPTQCAPSQPNADGQRRVGLMYERRVHDILLAIYEDRYTPSPTIGYRTPALGGGAVLCRAIPDGILRFPDWTAILEVKLAHTRDCVPQLDRYHSLVSLLEPRKPIRTVEICRSYDPAAYDGDHVLIDSLHRPKVGLEVLVWRI